MTFTHSNRGWKERLPKESVLPQLPPFLHKLIHATFLLISLLISANVYAATYTVNTTLDNESNGCGTGLCTLREAIADANASIFVSDTINFAPAATGTITLNGNALLITSDITINGPGARNLTVSGNDLSRVFVIAGVNTDAVISGLTVADGRAFPISFDGVSISDGGGILNTNGGTLNLSEVAIRNNHSTTFGGGISTRAILLTVARTTITGSTISGNTATLGGGGVSNTGTELLSNAFTTITNSTITNNSALAEGGGISNSLGDINLISNTITDNQAVTDGGGVVNLGVSPLIGSAFMRNNIVARNLAVLNTNLISSDLLGTFTSRGHNLIGNNVNVAVSFPIPNPNSDIVGSESGLGIIYPLLGNLQNNGGPTDTRLPLVGSPALDAGNNCVTDSSCSSNNPPASLTTDQRGTGFPRVANSTIDIGAVEGPAAPNTPYVVTTLADDESDGCDVNQCTLREAIDEANEAPDFDIINFAPALSGTIFLQRGQLVVSSNVTINGPGARNLTVSGSNFSRIFLVATPVLGGDFSAEINGLTITDGLALPVLNTLAGDGGGILNGALLGVLTGKPTLKLHEVHIFNNEATTFGGGVATRLGAETIITNSLINGNRCNGVPFVPGGDAGGGGVSNELSITTITNTTITNNNSLAAAGGLLNAGGQTHLTNNTITHNQSTLVGGGVVSLLDGSMLGITNLRNTIIAENRSLFGIELLNSDLLGVLGSFNSLGYNLIGCNRDVEVYFEASVFVGTTPQPNARLDLVGNIVIVNQIIDPLLGPLQNNGGPTDSRMPTNFSPAMNAADNCVVTNTCASNPNNKNPHTALLFDQRSNVARLIDSRVEIGSIEVPLAPSAAAASIRGRILDGSGRGIPRTLVRLTDSNGDLYTSVTNHFGYYRFENIPVGQTVVISPESKGYEFLPQVVVVEEDVINLNISALSSGLKMVKGR